MNRVLKPRPHNKKDSRLQNGKVGSIQQEGMMLVNSPTRLKKKKAQFPMKSGGTRDVDGKRST